MKISMLSGRKGLPEEMRTCGETGLQILVDEACYSQSDQKWYRKDLCSQSAESQIWGLTRKMVTCEITHKLLLPEETDVCVLTGKRMSLTCLAKSPVSGKLFYKELGLKALSGEILLREEAAFCNWEGGYAPTTEIGECAFSGLSFQQKYLRNGRLYIIVELEEAMKGSKKLEWKNLSTQFIQLLNKQNLWDNSFSLLSEGFKVKLYHEKDSPVLIFCASRTTKSLLFFTTYHYFYGIVSCKKDTFTIIGNPQYYESKYCIWNK